MSRKQTVGVFVLDNDLTYPWWIYVYSPDGKGGTAKTKFKAEFRHLSPDRRQQIMEHYQDQLAEQRDAEDSDDLVKTSSQLKSFQHALLHEVTLNVSNLRDAEGQDLTFDSDDPKFEQLLDNSWARSALFDGYMRSLQSRAPEKN